MDCRLLFEIFCEYIMVNSAITHTNMTGLSNKNCIRIFIDSTYADTN